MSLQEVSPAQPSARERFWRGAAAGLIAGILASAIMLLLSFALGSISLPDALGSAIAQAMPLPLFSFFHTVLGADAKHDLFYVVLLGQCAVFALFGGLCNLVVDRLALIVAHSVREGSYTAQ